MPSQVYMSPEALRTALAKLPRIPLAHLPTPLEECKRLTEAISPSGDGPPVFVKRDDLTGPALGGNKVRHMELRLGHARAQGCDTFIYGDVANAGRITAAACAKAGMRCILIVPEEESTPLQGNMLLAHLLGAELLYVGPGDREMVQREVRALAERLRQEGRKPYSIQQLPWFHISGIAAYLLATLELEQQLQERGIDKAHIFIVTGASHAGLQLGAKLLGLPWKITGIGVAQWFERDLPLAAWTQEAAEALGLPTGLTPGEIDVTFDYAGDYHLPTDGGIEAIKLAASAESIILDPSYTGKAMAGLTDHIRKGKVSPEETVVFIHTGGIPILFEHAQELSPGLAP